MIYVDDVLLVGSDLKKYLHDMFTIKDLGEAKHFLGVEISRSQDGIFLSQRKYILDLLQDSGMFESKPEAVPLQAGINFAEQCGKPLEDSNQYRRLIGRLLYLNFTGPNVSFAVNHLSQFMHRPCKAHMSRALQILSYLKGTIHQGLYYSITSFSQLECYTNTDYANCSDTRKSVFGNCIYLGMNLISWRSKKQSTVSQSSAEAEYKSMSLALTKLLWISYLLKDLAINIQLPVIMRYDNQAAIQITENPVYH